MRRKEALTELLAMAKAGEARPYHIEECSANIFRKDVDGDMAPWAIVARISQAYEGSLDAAEALHEAVLPNTAYDLSHWPNGRNHMCLTGTHEGRDGGRWHGKDDIRSEGVGDTPARAWLIAIVKALIAQEQEA